jgi:hypothetical protein
VGEGTRNVVLCVNENLATQCIIGLDDRADDTL